MLVFFFFRPPPLPVPGGSDGGVKIILVKFARVRMIQLKVMSCCVLS